MRTKDYFLGSGFYKKALLSLFKIERIVQLSCEEASLSEDKELEYLKQKKLLEMQRRLFSEKAAESQKEEPKKKEPDETLKTVFDNSAWEVWNLAVQQYPQVIEEVTQALVTLIKAGKIIGKINGEQIYWLFTQLGYRIRIETKIRILESGELKTIADKLRGK